MASWPAICSSRGKSSVRRSSGQASASSGVWSVAPSTAYLMRVPSMTKTIMLPSWEIVVTWPKRWCSAGSYWWWKLLR